MFFIRTYLMFAIRMAAFKYVSSLNYLYKYMYTKLLSNELQLKIKIFFIIGCWRVSKYIIIFKVNYQLAIWNQNFLIILLA